VIPCPYLCCIQNTKHHWFSWWIWNYAVCIYCRYY